jgi:MFS superfamily sulfate permease-like transporter
MTHVDYSAARVVIGLIKSLAEAGVVLAFARVPWDLHSDFDRHHLLEAIGPERIFNRLHDAIAVFEGLPKPPEGTANETISEAGARDSDSPAAG